MSEVLACKASIKFTEMLFFGSLVPILRVPFLTPSSEEFSGELLLSVDHPSWIKNKLLFRRVWTNQELMDLRKYIESELKQLSQNTWPIFYFIEVTMLNPTLDKIVGPMRRI
jgi:hypothetical protein